MGKVTLDGIDFYDAHLVEYEMSLGMVHPWFTKEEGHRIAEAYVDARRDSDDVSVAVAWYDDEDDNFYFRETPYEIAESFEVMEQDGVTLYGIGTGLWDWEEVGK